MRERYAAFGLLIASEFDLPSLAGAPVPPDGTPDIRFVRGAVPSVPDGERLLDMRAAMDGERLLLTIEDVGCMAIETDKVTLDPDPTASPAGLATYLLGSGMGAVLHMRRMLPIHSNAVVVGGRAYLFCGDSGAGKSTLAGHFLKQGLDLLTDDLCAVRATADGAIEALPGVPRLKLWQQSIDLLALDDATRVAVPWTDDKFEIARADAPSAPAPIAAIYHLREADEAHPPGIQQLGTLEALNTLTANIYRRRLADIAAHSYYLSMLPQLARLPVYGVRRRWGLEHFAVEVAAIEAHIGR